MCKSLRLHKLFADPVTKVRIGMIAAKMLFFMGLDHALRVGIRSGENHPGGALNHRSTGFTRFSTGNVERSVDNHHRPAILVSPLRG
jgi:hypothetical protein